MPLDLWNMSPSLYYSPPMSSFQSIFQFIKVGDSDNFTCFIPISLLYPLKKKLRKVVFKHDIYRKIKLLYEHQYLPKIQAYTYLSEYLGHKIILMEANILAIFLELTKAFDSCELEISQDNLCELVV